MKGSPKERRKEPDAIEQTYRSLVENIKDYAIFMLDIEGRVTSWDQGGVKLFGYKRDEIIGKNVSVFYTAEDVAKGKPETDMDSAVQEGRCLFERKYVKYNKAEFWGSGVFTSTRDKKGTHKGFSMIMRDVTQQTDLHKTAVHNSTHDFLTGLPNRNFFEEGLMEAIPNTKEGHLLAVLYMDFNNFKRTNDEAGHRFGDLVLIEIAHRLSRIIRLSDVAARFGGDEFVILAKNLRTQADVERVSKQVIEAFRIPILIEERTVRTSVSIGVALYPIHGKKPSELLRYSDMALYQAKKQGGNQYQIYDPDMKKPKISESPLAHVG